MAASSKRMRTKLPWKKELQRYWAAYLMLLLPLAVLIIFKYIPMYGAQIAFRDYKPTLGITGSPWVGLKYFLKYVDLNNPYFKIGRASCRE